MRAIFLLCGVVAATFHDDLLQSGWPTEDLVILHDAVGDAAIA